MSEKVYRTELTPLSFLRRSAYMFPEKSAESSTGTIISC